MWNQTDPRTDPCGAPRVRGAQPDWTGPDRLQTIWWNLKSAAFEPREMKTHVPMKTHRLQQLLPALFLSSSHTKGISFSSKQNLLCLLFQFWPLMRDKNWTQNCLLGTLSSRLLSPACWASFVSPLVESATEMCKWSTFLRPLQRRNPSRLQVIRLLSRPQQEQERFLPSNRNLNTVNNRII